MYLRAGSPGDINVLRAGGPRYKNIPGADSPRDINVPRTYPRLAAPGTCT